MQQALDQVSVTDWQKLGHYCDYQGYKVYCRHSNTSVSPQQPSLLLIHGFPTASWDWHRIWNAVAQSFELSAIDMLGFGLTDKPKTLNYSIAKQADLHEFMMQQRGISTTHLLVHDYGVSVAQELLARQLEGRLSFQILSCVFLNGGLFHGVHRPLLIQKILASPFGFLLSPFMGKAAMRRSMQRIFSPSFQPDEWEIEQMWALLERAGGKQVIAKVSGYMHERKHYYQRWLTALTDANISLRLVVGSVDPISGSNLATAYRQLIPKPDVIELTNTGHYPQLENPQAVIEACQSFWSPLV